MDVDLCGDFTKLLAVAMPRSLEDLQACSDVLRQSEVAINRLFGDITEIHF